ncbi:hypothetical protein TcBrA4_0121320 [Trypanosoma cruzi]|nr:hypothetical protein TcBrA4_0121320 [Trypanosoma cruzi]
MLLRVHTLWSMFLFRMNYPLLGGISQALAHNGAALGGSFSSGCCTTRCGLCFVSNYEWRESETLSMYVCVFTHWTPNNFLNYVCVFLEEFRRAQPTMIRCLEEFRKLLPTMVLHSADRFRAAAAPHVVVYVFVSNYEWRESEALSFNVCLRVHTLDTKQP